MWHSPSGDRTLEGAEAKLFRFGLVSLLRRLPAYNAEGYFDRLTRGEKLIALAASAKALLDPTEASPEHSAWMESAIYAVYCHMQERARSSKKVQQLTAAACRQTELCGGELPARRDTAFALEALADLVLWDRDWELEDELSQEEGDDYFAPPPVADPERVQTALDRLRALIGRDWYPPW
jgi:hypothetical protein